MSNEESQVQDIASTRRQVIGRTAKIAAGLPFLLLPNIAEAHNSRHIRWYHGWHNGRYSFGHRQAQTKGKTAQNCFLRGTSILTTEGEIRIEDISIGDRVETVEGHRLPVKWIGRQRFRKTAESDWQKSILPVCVSRFALDDRTPHKDLYLSPGHALFIEGALIPAGYLINDRSVVQALPEGTEDIEYFHIELETHEVIFAEGLPTETFLVKYGREMFDNFVEYERLYGADDCSTTMPYSPIAGYNGGRSVLKALLRRAVSPVVDMRDPIQVAYDKIAGRCVERA